MHRSKIVIFHFDMKSVQRVVFRCRFLEAVCRMIRVVALPGKPIILHFRVILQIRPAIILRLRGILLMLCVVQDWAMVRAAVVGGLYPNVSHAVLLL